MDAARGEEQRCQTVQGLTATLGREGHKLGWARHRRQIVSSHNGKLYVGKADGRERILCRWSDNARDGHGGNVARRDLAGLDPTHARHFVFSILRVFGPSVIATRRTGDL